MYNYFIYVSVCNYFIYASMYNYFIYGPKVK